MNKKGYAMMQRAAADDMRAGNRKIKQRIADM